MVVSLGRFKNLTKNIRWIAYLCRKLKKVFGKRKKYPVEKRPKDRKFRLIVANNKSFEEKFSFSFSISNALIYIVSFMLIGFIASFLIIVFTPVKEYIPGYAKKSMLKEIYRLNRKADSLMIDLRRKNLYIENIKRILNNDTVYEDYAEMESKEVNYDTITLRSSKEDSLFRADFENEQMFNLYFSESKPAKGAGKGNVSIRDFNFFIPLQGIITSHFDLRNRHFGVDIVSGENEAVKASLQGTVILADWTLETGYIVAIQHPAGILSVYKHCSALLVKEGDPVDAGDPIAFSGQSGEQQTGPHLHFEIWHKGTPVNPEKYILFQ